MSIQLKIRQNPLARLSGNDVTNRNLKHKISHQLSNGFLRSTSHSTGDKISYPFYFNIFLCLLHSFGPGVENVEIRTFEFSYFNRNL